MGMYRREKLRKLLQTYTFGDPPKCWMGEDMSAAQIIAQLQAALRKLEEAEHHIGSAGKAASEARHLAAGALEGSSGQLVAQLDQLIQTLGQVSQMPAKTKEQVHMTITRTQALGN
ncbi:DUF6244 family protein [Plantactinospora sp. B24E8]|uniref:DUF6244 family protein n=1 Tax=Plantactinospora sp. B24E8 TaxID=3153567 RepID=UPI00325E201C